MTGPHLVVAMPARDEALRIGAALAAVEAATGRLHRVSPAATVTVVVAADDCRDATAAIAHAGGAVVVVTRGGVGAARAAAVDRALELVPDACWIANTDADSRVPETWLLTHLAAEQTGTDLLLGSVRPDLVEAGLALAARWAAHDRPRELHDHVHGANLGIRPATYRAAGGFADAVVQEDVLLVRRCRRLGATVRSTDRSPVTTSARLRGRTTGGFSGWLRAAALPDDDTVLLE